MIHAHTDTHIDSNAAQTPQRAVAPQCAIESFSVYLPEKEVTTHDVVQGCVHSHLIPLKRMTGIHSRRMAADNEFSIDLARKAIAQCLPLSRHSPEDIDLLVAANISKFDGKDCYTVEPNTATVLRKEFGCVSALAFDISNACAGIFTAIKVVEEMIKYGDVRRALVVSGEYITHLTKTAQREMRGLRDPRMACLTLGDAGVCLVLEKADGPSGFSCIDLYTVPEHAELCVAHASEESGAIMFTDAVGLAESALADALPHYKELITQQIIGADYDYIIPHQTSSNAIRHAIRKTNHYFGRKIISSKTMVDNLEHRGNTATTAHWVVLNDLINNGAVTATSESVLFCIQASGVTVGYAEYKHAGALANSVSKSRKSSPSAKHTKQKSGDAMSAFSCDIPVGERVAITGAATYTDPHGKTADNVELASQAVRQVITRASAADKYLSYLIYGGVYRKNYFSEPALATLIAHRIGIKGSVSDVGQRRLLAFDILNGETGIIESCFVANRLLHSKGDTVIVSSSEYPLQYIDNKGVFDIHNMGSALLLENSAGQRGFSAFGSYSYPDHQNSYHAYTPLRGFDTLVVERDAHIERAYREAIARSVDIFLKQHKTRIEDCAVIYPPQISPEFIAALSNDIHADPQQMVTCHKNNLYTSSFAAGWEQSPLSHTGDVGLCISVGPGINVACALYTY